MIRMNILRRCERYKKTPYWHTALRNITYVYYITRKEVNELNLYELTGKYQELLNYAQSVDFTDEDNAEALSNTLDAIEDSIEVKAESIAHVIKQLEYDELIVNEEIKRYQKKKKALVNNQKRLKEYLQSAMEFVEKDKIKTPKFSIHIQNNPPKLVVEDESEIPEAYWVEQPPKLNKRLLLQDLKEEDYPEFKGARVVQERGLRIR